MKLTCATYNILHGYYKDQIFKNIKTLIEKGADVICIQEAEIEIESVLPSGWKIEYFRHDIGCNLAIAWNSPMLDCKEKKTILYQPLPKPAFMQRLTNYKNKIIPRGAITVLFTFTGEGKTIRITNTHLAWEGGMKNKAKELKELLQFRGGEKVDTEILAGDFNTNIPAVLRRVEERRVENILGKEFDNVFPNIKYTCDLSYTDPQDGLEKIAKFWNFFGVKLKSRLDYIFTKNLKIISKEMLDLPGSDHRPLLATFEV